jgi:hypothetical protein
VGTMDLCTAETEGRACVRASPPPPSFMQPFLRPLTRALFSSDTNNGVGITLYAPNINLVRDPRWGRAQEVYSEDPMLTSELTVGFVTGAQGALPINGSALEEPQLLTVACCKHLAACTSPSRPGPDFCANRFTLLYNISLYLIMYTIQHNTARCIKNNITA